MAILFISEPDDAVAWGAALAEHLPGVDFRVWPEGVGDPADIDYALVWLPPPGALRRYANLKAIFNLGAGVDALLRDDTLPAVPIVRLVDAALTRGMSEYVIHWVLHFHRGFHVTAADQRRGRWRPVPTPETSARRVGVMGLGEIGADAARHLVRLGFDVAGWSRTPKDIEGVRSLAGEAGLEPFLERTEILVCLLPLTAATAGIVNRETIAHLPRGAFLINAARGGHVVDGDLIEALDTGRLAGAALDVFDAEPLPPDHPFWSHPGIALTPHMASLTLPRSATAAIAANIARMEAGEAPLDVVDGARGY